MACTPVRQRVVHPVPCRWRIVHNLADALERMAVRALAQMHNQRATNELSTPANRAPSPLPVTPSRIQSRNERRHADIHALRGKGLTLAAIAEQLHLNRTTVRKFVGVSSAAELRRPAGEGPSALDRFTPYL